MFNVGHVNGFYHAFGALNAASDMHTNYGWATGYGNQWHHTQTSVCFKPGSKAAPYLLAPKIFPIITSDGKMLKTMHLNDMLSNFSKEVSHHANGLFVGRRDAMGREEFPHVRLGTGTYNADNSEIGLADAHPMLA
jgi:hypothetical protein